MSTETLSFQEKRDWLRLIRSENVGPVTFFKLIAKFGSAREALHALPEISARGGLKRPIKLCKVETAERELEYAEQIGATLIAACESQFPALLKQIDGSPPVIYTKGQASLFDRPSVALVGSRNASAVGRNFSRTLASELGEAGYVTVSGLARGIDTSVHQASIRTGTIGVIAGGIDVFYPPENQSLQHEMSDVGLVVTEMPARTRPQARHFPRRNRIISGLCVATIVVEAATRSGSLITARLANEQGREVFAVPGSPMDPRAGGTNKLIQDGATIITSTQDVINALQQLGERHIEQSDLFGGVAEEDDFAMMDDDVAVDIHQQVTSLLSPTPTSIDDLVRETGASVQAVQSVLLELDLAGRLERHTGHRVSIL